MLQDLNIGRRLALAFGAVIALYMLVGAISVFTAQRLKEADKINTHTHVVLGKAADMLTGMINMETGTRGFLLSGNEGHLAPWRTGQEQFDQAWQALKALTADNPVQQKRLDDMKQRSADFKAVAQGLIAYRLEVNKGRLSTSALAMEFSAGRDKAAMDGFRAVQADFIKMEEALLEQRAAHADGVRLANTLANVLGTVTALVLAMVLGTRIARSIVEPVQAAVHVAERVAAGELDVRIEVKSQDETGRLLAALQRMTGSLATLVNQVRSSSDSIATGSSEIAMGNTDLSQRTEQQAANLQQTAASMEQLSATVLLNAETARQASELAGRARDAATSGGAVVGEVICTMEQITASSRKINDIIAVIDGIAFQTNILALNAAVEAARAGEQGRGFAVVATEVRGLAQRSANAAKEIKVLINQSVETVEAGSRLVGDAGKHMESIVNQVRNVSELIQEISSASVEQTAGIEQMNNAVSQLDQVTQQNAALVEEAAAAAASLKSQAHRLVDAVAVFKL
jgi:methyl-accepting chemotaxis protein